MNYHLLRLPIHTVLDAVMSNKVVVKLGKGHMHDSRTSSRGESPDDDILLQLSLWRRNFR